MRCLPALESGRPVTPTQRTLRDHPSYSVRRALAEVFLGPCHNAQLLLCNRALPPAGVGPMSTPVGDQVLQVKGGWGEGQPAVRGMVSRRVEVPFPACRTRQRAR